MIFFATLKNSFSILNDLKFHILLIFLGMNQHKSSHFHFSVLYLVLYKLCRYDLTQMFLFSMVFYVFIVHKLLIFCFSNF